jgi:hypothetical protein
MMQVPCGCASLDHAANLSGITRAVGWSPQHLWRRLAFVARTKRAALHKRRYRLRHAMRGQLFWPLGSFRCDRDPLFGDEVLAQLGQVNPSNLSHRHVERILRCPDSCVAREPNDHPAHPTPRSRRTGRNPPGAPFLPRPLRQKWGFSTERRWSSFRYLRTAPLALEACVVDPIPSPLRGGRICFPRLL